MEHSSPPRKSYAVKDFPAILAMGNDMARRRFQKPTLVPRGQWWVIWVRVDVFEDGKYRRKQTIKRIAPLSMKQREAQKVLDEYLRPMNQGLEAVGSATNFTQYVESTYLKVVLPLLASTTQSRYRGVINNYLIPAFGKKCLRDLKPVELQAYFTGMVNSKLSHESKDKIRDVMSAIMKTTVTYELLLANPMEKVRIPPEKRGKKRNKPFITPAQFKEVIDLIPEPYATMVYVAVYTGLRISELCALRWENVNAEDFKISIEERYCRGDFSAPKSEASNATVGVAAGVVERIEGLRGRILRVKAGTGTRIYQLAENPIPQDLVFRSIVRGMPMRDNNILSRHIKPAGRKLNLPFLNWQVLRRSFATWLKIAGVDVKDAQGLMRHSRASTTLDIYQQMVPESQRRAVEKLSKLGKVQ